MKPVKKDAPRQARRERTLTRLENYLKGGVKNQKSDPQDRLVGYKKNGQPIYKQRGRETGKMVPFEQKDIDRIKRDIAILKSRLGKSEVVDGYKRV